MALGDAQEFFDLKDGVSALEVRVRDVYAAGDVAGRIEAALGKFPFRARAWTEANRDLLMPSGLRVREPRAGNPLAATHFETGMVSVGMVCGTPSTRRMLMSSCRNRKLSLLEASSAAT